MENIFEPRTQLARRFSENSHRGTEQNVQADTALDYVMEGNFVERLSGSRQKIKLLIVIVLLCK